MFASFLIIFVAFAICQALLTIKFADFLSPADQAQGTADASRSMTSAKLA